MWKTYQIFNECDDHAFQWMRHIFKIPDIWDVRRAFNESNLNINEMVSGKYISLGNLRFSKRSIYFLIIKEMSKISKTNQTENHKITPLLPGGDRAVTD